MADNDAPERIWMRADNLQGEMLEHFTKLNDDDIPYVRERAAPDAAQEIARQALQQIKDGTEGNRGRCIDCESVHVVADDALLKMESSSAADAVRQARREKTLTGCPCVETERSQCGTEACWHFTNKGICEMCANTGYLDLAVAQAELWDRINVILGGFGANIRKADLIEALQKERTG